MIIVHPPSTERDTGALESLDWVIPCEDPRHSGNPQPAAWAVWSKPARPCGCPVERHFIYMCDPCWDRYVKHRAYCSQCFKVYPWSAWVQRAERI